MAARIEKEQARVVILLGPTGVGKSKLVLEWAEELGGEILSADSMQVYRYMDIGTAKPTPDDQKRVRHHLIDLVTPDQSFHAALYRTLGRKTIDQLYQDKKPIWVVGGTRERKSETGSKRERGGSSLRAFEKRGSPNSFSSSPQRPLSNYTGSGGP